MKNPLNIARNFKSNMQYRFHKDQLWTAGQVCEILGAKLPEGLPAEEAFSMICCFEGIFVPKCLYVQYERDGIGCSRYAMNNGARAILSAKQIENFPCIIVDDVLTALRKLCIPMYEDIAVPATVVIGSIGKTTTKQFLNCVYSTHFRTFCNVTNGNTFEYLGYELQRFDRRAERFIQEVNESDPFNARNCSLVLKPRIALITNMDKSHIGELGSEENIMKAIHDITAGMDADSVVILNADDPNSMKVNFEQRVITVAIENHQADCIASNICSSGDQMEFDLTYAGETVHVTIPVSGKHNIYNAQMVYIAGRLNGIPVEKILNGLKNYKPIGFRQNVYKLGGRKLYVDCYNASARSIGGAIRTMDNMHCKKNGRRIAVLGDIAEIEGYEKETYREIGRYISDSKINVLITFGRDSQMIHDSVSRENIMLLHASEREELNRLIKTHTGKNDMLLFKASRSMNLERSIRDVFPLVYVKGMMTFWIKYLHWTIRTL